MDRYFGLFDSHAHIDDKRFNNDRKLIIDCAIKNKMSGIINVGTDIISSQRSIYLANQYALIYAAIGIHPHNAKNALKADFEQLQQWSTLEPKVIAIGEIGLDYHYNFSPVDVQKKIFITQLEIAKSANIPIIIHNRESTVDMMNIVKQYSKNLKGVFHCYTGSIEILKELLKMDFYVSIGGPITFKNAYKLKELIKYIPINKLLIETDCPYLTPEPYRGKRNEPIYVKYVCETVATLLELPLEQLIKSTTNNARELFMI